MVCPHLCCCPPDEVQPLVQFSQLVVAAAAIAEDLDTGQRKVNVWGTRCEQLLAGLGCGGGGGGVRGGQRLVKEREMSV